MNTNLGRTETAVLTNQSGGSVAQGDIVVLDTGHAASFVTTAVAAYAATRVGVVIEPNGIASGSNGLIAFTGFVPKINLNSAAGNGDFVNTYSAAKLGAPHASPAQQGDFAEVLGTGTSPAAILLGMTVQTSSGGGQYFAPTGLTGATSVSRYVGATAIGAPVTGTFGVGDFVIDLTGTIWICTSAGTPGVWANLRAGASALVLLEQHTASGVASLDFTTGITSTYDDYLFDIIDLLPANNAVQLYMRAHSGGGFDSSSKYVSSNWAWVYNATATTGSAIGSPAAQLITANAADVSNTAGYGVCGDVHLFNPLGSVNKKITGQLTWPDSGAVVKGSSLAGLYLNTAAVDGWQFLFSAGNIASGTIRMYGIAKV